MFEKLYEIITSLPSNSVLREHKELFMSQLLAADNRIRELQSDIADLRSQKRKLEEKVAAYAEIEQFVEYKGVFFKKAVGTINKYHSTPRCLACKTPLSFVGAHLVCPSCDWRWRFGPAQLKRYSKELEEMP